MPVFSYLPIIPFIPAPPSEEDALSSGRDRVRALLRDLFASKMGASICLFSCSPARN